MGFLHNGWDSSHRQAIDPRRAQKVDALATAVGAVAPSLRTARDNMWRTWQDRRLIWDQKVVAAPEALDRDAQAVR